MTAFGYSISQAKSLFFNPEAVLKETARQERKALSKFGAYVRTSARRSIRKRKSPSKPGQAPSDWTGLLRKFIFFGYDPSTRSVVIGPALLNGPRRQAIGQTGPELLEEGGRARQTAFDRRTGGKTRRTVRVSARPFMGPAFQENLPQAEKLWRRDFS